MRIHFVYAGHPDMGAIQAPYIITHKLFYFLKSKVETFCYNWTDKIDLDLQPDDIVLGHPHYDPETVVQRAFRRQCRAKCLIHPLHTRRVNDNFPFDPLVQQADRLFAICGPYWYDSIGETPFAHWKPKITRLDLAVDPNTYPYLKHSFNPPGARRLVYIGSATPNKNLGYLVKVMAAMPDVTLHWYGGDSNHPLAKLPNVNTSGWLILDESVAKSICHHCDIKVSVSDSDANPTTLLEAAAWGLITACTKESGYYNDPMFHELYLDDLPRTIDQLRHLLTIDNGQLEEMSRQSRKTIEDKYTWDRFCNTVWNELCSFL